MNFELIKATNLSRRLVALRLAKLRFLNLEDRGMLTEPKRQF